MKTIANIRDQENLPTGVPELVEFSLEEGFNFVANIDDNVVERF